eukprot:CAMPEP_0195102208 /NCGR_PEP_ID=MMETSP0448-20130528/66542_1 /TAXON_ID=66468 /ORGANISM="Heterocapsa triquestra, Strain CCMP 448" /LENGTH=56 /DNA_ID=CAMNT_0040137657 /DNA_START=118 /DNA_END=284 /DNA_ORIENTATION=+
MRLYSEQRTKGDDWPLAAAARDHAGEKQAGALAGNFARGSHAANLARCPAAQALTG